MKIGKHHLLLGLVVAEACVITFLFLNRVKIVRNDASTKDTVQNPLKIAIEFEASEKKFKDLVDKYPEWISHRFNHKGMWNSPILADAAILNQTNYVRILIARNADVESAIGFLKEVGSTQSIALIRQIQSEIAHK